MEVISLRLNLNNLDEESIKYLNACFSGNIQKIRELLKENPHIVQDIPLGIENACQENQIEVVRFLLYEGKMNIKAEGKGAISTASYYGHYELVNFLLSIGADASEFRNSPVILASKNGHSDLVKLLVRYGADLSVDSDWCLFSAAASSGDFETIKFLINIGGDPESQNNILTKICCEKGYTRILQYLADKISFSNLQERPTYLALASANGQLDVIRFLIENHCDIHANNNCAYESAIRFNQKDSLEMLISMTNDKEKINLSGFLSYAKNLKSMNIQEPSSCIAYLKELLHIEDDFPRDLIIDTDDCPVCDEKSDLILPCRHIICKRCYYMILEKICPVCRYKIDENLVRKRVH